RRATITSFTARTMSQAMNKTPATISSEPLLVQNQEPAAGAAAWASGIVCMRKTPEAATWGIERAATGPFPPRGPAGLTLILVRPSRPNIAGPDLLPSDAQGDEGLALPQRPPRMLEITEEAKPVAASPLEPQNGTAHMSLDLMNAFERALPYEAFL